MPEAVIAGIIGHFATLQKVMRATVEDLETVAGVEALNARIVKDGLSRLAESSILDRFS